MDISDECRGTWAPGRAQGVTGKCWRGHLRAGCRQQRAVIALVSQVVGRKTTNAGTAPRGHGLAYGHGCQGAGQAKAQSRCRWLRKPRSPAGGNGAVQKARIIVPVTRATIVLIEVRSCARTLWTRPKPTTSVTQESASITTLRCVRRLSASSEELFMLPPKTSLSLVGACRQKVHGAGLYI